MTGTSQSIVFSGNPLPPKLPEQNARRPIVFAFAALAAMSAVAVLFFFNPGQYGFYPKCYLHAATGLNCPGCGALRALHQLLHGHIVEATRLNIFLMLCLLFFGWRAIRFLCGNRRQPGEVFSLSPVWLWTFLGIALVFTVLRNLSALAWLAP